ncbi:MAG: hypothetical protein ACO3C8_03475, partial [Bacilli bacterium]
GGRAPSGWLRPTPTAAAAAPPNLDQLATLNDQFATLLASSETMLTPLTALVTLLTDVQALLASKL